MRKHDLYYIPYMSIVCSEHESISLMLRFLIRLKQFIVAFEASFQNNLNWKSPNVLNFYDDIYFQKTYCDNSL